MYQALSLIEIVRACSQRHSCCILHYVLRQLELGRKNGFQLFAPWQKRIHMVLLTVSCYCRWRAGEWHARFGAGQSVAGRPQRAAQHPGQPARCPCRHGGLPRCSAASVLHDPQSLPPHEAGCLLGPLRPLHRPPAEPSTVLRAVPLIAKLCSISQKVPQHNTSHLSSQVNPKMLQHLCAPERPCERPLGGG